MLCGRLGSHWWEAWKAGRSVSAAGMEEVFWMGALESLLEMDVLILGGFWVISSPSMGVGTIESGDEAQGRRNLPIGRN